MYVHCTSTDWLNKYVCEYVMPVVCSITVHVLGTAARREQIGAILAAAVSSTVYSAPH